MIEQQLNGIIEILKVIKNNDFLIENRPKMEHIIIEFDNIKNNVRDIVPSSGLRRHLNKLNESLIQLFDCLKSSNNAISEDKILEMVKDIFHHIKLFSIFLIFEEANILFKKSSDIDVQHKNILENQAENISHNASLLIDDMLNENMQNVQQIINTLSQAITSTKQEVERLQKLVQNVRDIANIVSIFDSLLGIVSVL